MPYQLNTSYGSQFINPNAYSQYSTVPHDPGIAPSGAAQFLWNLGQYGVSALMPGVGALAGAGMNMLGQYFQNQQQERFYNQYMSPQARMSQMKAAGINPAAAAQGIAGASAPQMNAAAPTSAFTGIGEQLGNSVNTALTAKNIAAQTKNLEMQSEGQRIQNQIAKVELGIKPSMLSAELDDLKASVSEKRQNVDNLKQQVKESQATVNKLKAEESYITTQEGAISYENQLKIAQKQENEARAALEKAEKEYQDELTKYQQKENENYLTPEERIKMPIETGYNVDPIHADFTDVHNSKKTLEAILDQYESNQIEIYRKYDAGEISDKEYLDLMKENDMLARQTRVSLRNVNKAFDNLSYKNGYHSWWQDNASNLIDSATRLAGQLGGAAIVGQGAQKAAAIRVPIFRNGKNKNN